MTPSPRLRVVFAGTPEFAAQHLKALIEQCAQDPEHTPFELVAVYSQPDRPAGRGKKLSASPVKVLAEANDITVYQPENFKESSDRQILAELKADLMVVVAYGLLLPKSVLDIPRYGCINVHGSLLPRWRGAAPIQRAVEAGDTTTGVTIMKMDVGLDTGDMLLKASCDISPSDSSASLHDKLIELGTPALLTVLSQIALCAHENKELKGEAQDDSLSCYARKISKQEASINWNLSAEVLDRQIRAFRPFPIAYTLHKGERLKIWQARPLKENSAAAPGTLITLSDDGLEIACGEGRLLLNVIQIPSKKAMSVKDLLKGYKDRFVIDELLGQ